MHKIQLILIYISIGCNIIELPATQKDAYHKFLTICYALSPPISNCLLLIPKRTVTLMNLGSYLSKMNKL